MMTPTIFFWVLPAVYLAFALIFAWVARSARDLPTPRWAAMAFAAAVIAIPLDTLREPPFASAFLLAIPLHWLILVAMLNAFLSRHGELMPRATVLRIFAAGIAAIIVTSWVLPSVAARVTCVTLVALALIHVGMMRLHRLAVQPFDRLVAWTVTLAWASYLLRGFAFLLPGDAPEFSATPLWSQYRMFFYFVSGISALINGLTLVVAVTMDMMSRHSIETETDALTGVGNRRLLDRIAAQPDRHPPFGAVLMIDLDRFKAFNDSHGHAAGDRLLVATASRLRSMLDPEARLVRMGGEEFAVLLPAHLATAAPAIAETLRSGIAGNVIDLDGASAHATASIGLARTGPGERLIDALRRADTALYRAKAEGRNRVETADEPAAARAA
jgi:diguanylate cyclase (GGDEF)-like protein